MTGPEHYREAERLADRAHHYTYGDGGDPVVGQPALDHHLRELSMSTFYPEYEGLPSEDDISAFLAYAGGDDGLAHPYDDFPATNRPRPNWRGGPPLTHADERGYLDEQDDQP